MKITKSERGFRFLEVPVYLDKDAGKERLVSESSAIGEYEDSFDKPGSSFLWVGNHHHLNREQIALLVDVLNHWLEKKKLPEVVGVKMKKRRK